MLKATSSRTGGCQVDGEGSIAEQLNDLLNIIQSVHNSMLRIGEPTARAFRAMLISHLLHPNSKVWEPANGEGYTIVKPGEGGDGNG
jgi:hypothetical protein